MYKRKVANRLGKCLNVILYWWVFFQFIYWKISLFGTFATHAFSRLFKCEQCDREETQKHLQSTHKHVGILNLNVTSVTELHVNGAVLNHIKKRKYIKYQCDHCHYKPSTNQSKTTTETLKDKSTFVLTCQSHIT